MAEQSKRLKYSRELVLSCREPASRMNFPSIVIPTRIPRGARKKSQSTDTEGNNHPGGSREDLNAEEVDPSWRPNRQPWHHNNNNSTNTSNHAQHQSGHFANHSRQRYPSGPHVDTTQSTTNISLRAAPPSENRKGGHGDWSRGCAGWRQRSYSGSERSELVSGVGHFRGRGAGHFGGDSDENVTRNRGRGRASNRYVFPQRGGVSSRGHHPTHGAHRPVSFIDNTNSSENAEEFWQDEDWDSVGLDSATHFDFPSKPRERLNSKASVEGLPAAINETQSVGSASVTDEPSQMIRDFNKVRIHSKSCSADPPPGFDAQALIKPIEKSKPASAPLKPAASETQASGSSLPDVTSSRWYYIDSVGRTQGPFIQQQMSAWLTGGYLPLTIEIRRDCDECFLTLGEHINLTGQVPFSEGYRLPPLTRSSLPPLMAASNKPAPNPRWINTVAPPSPHPPTGIEPPPFSPSINNAMAAATAAAAPALALFFATAAGLSSPATQQSTHPSQAHSSVQQPQPATAALPMQTTSPVLSSTLSTPSSAGPVVGTQPTTVSGTDPEILRLYTEAQALAAHAAKVEAERQELVDKIAAINSTAAKLLATSPGLSSSTDLLESASTKIAPLATVSSSPTVAVSEHNQLPEISEGTLPSSSSLSGVPEVLAEGVSTEIVTDVLQQNTTTLSQGESNSKIEQNLVTESASAFPVEIHPLSMDEAVESQTCDQVTNDAVDVSNRKAKKKNKKSKKKTNSEQERQLAWNAEFERRKAAALERKLAEEAEQQRIADEETAAAMAAEQAEMKEQLRLLAEQRKREQARAKVANQMGQLRLPKTSCWGNSATGADSGESNITGAGSNSLLAIQAAQAMEEAERKKREAFVAEPAALLATVEAEVAQVKPSQAWSSVVTVNVKGTAKQPPVPKVTPSKAEVSTRTSLGGQTKASTSGANVAVPPSTKVPITAASVGSTKISTTVTAAHNPASSGPSIWDLPNNGKTEPVSSVGKSSKKHKKKNTRINREAASYAAKEQLAHWCESQLSSMPLSGVDLPTLVDLLCELEAAEQVVEFIESSLGRSKQISQFSKAFLEKRACVLHAP